MDVSFRKATEEDLPFLTELRRQTMREHYLNAGLAFDEEEQLKRIKDHYENAELITLEGKNIGMVKVVRETMPWQFKQIQIAPEYQRRGIGKKIIRHILDEADKEKASVELGVLKNNPARNLYERLGFRVIGEKESACVMRYSLPKIK